MSFLIDPYLLFIGGVAVFLAGDGSRTSWMGWERHARIAAGVALVAAFWGVSAMLYLDAVRCVLPDLATFLPLCHGMRASEFMLQRNFTGLAKPVAPLLPLLLFALYPLWTFAGYSVAMSLYKKRRFCDGWATAGLALLLAYLVLSLALYFNLYPRALALAGLGPGAFPPPLTADPSVPELYTAVATLLWVVLTSAAYFVTYPLLVIALGCALALLLTKDVQFKRRRYTLGIEHDIEGGHRRQSYRELGDGGATGAESGRAQEGPSRYAIVRDADPRSCARRAVAELGRGLGWVSGEVTPANAAKKAQEAVASLIKGAVERRGADKGPAIVVVKANVCGGVGRTPGSYSSIAVVEEVVGLVRAAGVEPVVCDADMIWTDLWPAAANEGWAFRWDRLPGHQGDEELARRFVRLLGVPVAEGAEVASSGGALVVASGAGTATVALGGGADEAQVRVAGGWEPSDAERAWWADEGGGAWSRRLFVSRAGSRTYVCRLRMENLCDTELVLLDFGSSSVLGMTKVSKLLIDADVIISLPTMKTHALTGITIGMKNMYGTFPEVDKAKFHHAGIEEVILEVNRAFTPDLTVVDGTIGGEDYGPLNCAPVVSHTVVASNDVVKADAVSCRVMGYEPKDIVHLRRADEGRLGDLHVDRAEVLARLSPPHVAGKDGDWHKLDHEVWLGSESAFEAALAVPGLAAFANHGADFFMYDIADMPILCYLVPPVMQAGNDLVAALSRGSERWHPSNVLVVLALAALALVLAQGEGLLAPMTRTTLLADLAAVASGLARLATTYLLFNAAVIVLALWTAARARPGHLLAAVASSAIVGYAVERLASSAGLWAYAGGLQPPLSAILGWVPLVLAALGLAAALAPLLSSLGLIARLEGEASRPLLVLLAAALMAALMWLEGYLAVAGPGLLALYALMAIIGVWYAAGHRIEWTASVLGAALALGAACELLGQAAGVWAFRFGEGLPWFLPLGWALNALAVFALAALAGWDLEGALEEVEA